MSFCAKYYYVINLERDDTTVLISTMFAKIKNVISVLILLSVSFSCVMNWIAFEKLKRETEESLQLRNKVINLDEKNNKSESEMRSLKDRLNQLLSDQKKYEAKANITEKKQRSRNKIITKLRMETEKERKLNNSRNFQFLIYNRAPKCGSTTLKNLLATLSKTNYFKYMLDQIGLYKEHKLTKKQVVRFKKMIHKRQMSGEFDAYAFVRHLTYTEVGNMSHGKVFYINFIRDPVSRFTSDYFYRRTRRDVAKVQKEQHGEGWANKSISTCLQDPRDMECERPASILKYFANPPWAERAIHNIDHKFIVVGVTEMYQKSLAVLECLLPKFFKGAVELYNNGKKVKNSIKHPTLTLTEKNILRGRLKGEQRAYDHAVKKLKKQYEDTIQSGCIVKGIKY